MTQQILVPVPAAPAGGVAAPRAPRRDAPRTALLLDNSKTHGDTILEHVGRMLAAEGWRLRRLRKRTASSPAPPDALERLAAESTVCFTALAD